MPIPAKLKGLKTEITANPFQKLSWTTTDFILKNIIGALLARVSSQLRRYHKYLEATSTQKNQNIYTVGGVELNLATKTVSVNNQPIKVTTIEFK